MYFMEESGLEVCAKVYMQWFDVRGRVKTPNQ